MFKNFSEHTALRQPSTVSQRVGSHMSNSLQRFWIFWIFLLAISFVVQVSTLDVMPSLQKDEIQIADYGRLILHPRSDWSVNWLVTEEKPILLWTYLGPLISELSYLAGGTSGLGPRIAGVAGGLVAATIALLWLLARRVPLYAACCLGFAFLLDPLLVFSERQGRMDSWVLAFCITSCWLLRTSSSNKQSFLRGRVMAAGGFAAAAALVWPSAIFLYPLIILEFYCLIRAEPVKGNVLKSVLVQGFFFMAGGLIALILLLFPIWNKLLIIFNDMPSMVNKNVDTSRSFTDRLFAVFSYPLWVKFFKAFAKTLSIFLPILAVIGALYRRDKPLIIASISVIMLLFGTLIYELRVLYLLPYFLLLGSGIFYHSPGLSSWRPLLKVRSVALFILVIWSAGTSLGLRTAFGVSGKAARDRGRLLQAANTSIGPGAFKVFLGFTYEYYYTGRSLGWKMYTPYGQLDYDGDGNWIDKGYHPRDKFRQLFSQMDYAVFNKSSITTEMADELATSGMEYHNTMLEDDDIRKKKSVASYNRTIDLLLYYLRGEQAYGPYVVYSRKKNISNTFKSRRS